MALGTPTWKASGGLIESSGSYVAGDTEGSFIIEISSGGVKGSATVLVAKQAKPGETGGTGSGGPKPPVNENVAAVQWTGQVPTAKWMSFYTKVLSKFAKEKGVTLKATFELRPDGGLTKQQVDELRAALRELALDDDLRSD